MLMPPLDIMGKIDFSNPKHPKLKSKVTKKQLKQFQTFVKELNESGKTNTTSDGFEVNLY